MNRPERVSPVATPGAPHGPEPGALAQAVGAAFDDHGPLSQAAEGFRLRDGQTRLALALARVIEQGGVLVAEAATGVGKTFAYLVPALLSGERVLLSTATKTLQDQLFGRDLPRLARALGLPVSMALLKGRASCTWQARNCGQSAPRQFSRVLVTSGMTGERSSRSGSSARSPLRVIFDQRSIFDSCWRTPGADETPV